MRPCYLRSYWAGHELPGAPELPRKQARFLSPVGVLAVRAALYTAPVYDSPPSRRGVFSATGPSRFDPKHLGARLGNIDPGGPLWKGALGEVDPFSLLKIMSSSVLAIASMMLPAEGASAHLCEDALGGLMALERAQQAISYGELDDAAVISFDDLTSDLSKAELVGSLLGGAPFEAAVMHLSSSPKDAPYCLEEISLLYQGQGEVGGAAGLGRLVRSLDTPSQEAKIAVHGGGAFVRWSPTTQSARS